METENQIQQGFQKTIADVVCPKCYNSIPYPSMPEQGHTDRYGRTIRTYFGWCFKCGLGHQVIQFLQYGKWHIHKYQTYRLVSNENCKPFGDWIIVNELPEPAPVVLGPGGDYDKQINLDAESINLLHSLKSALANTCNILDKLLMSKE